MDLTEFAAPHYRFSVPVGRLTTAEVGGRSVPLIELAQPLRPDVAALLKRQGGPVVLIPQWHRTPGGLVLAVTINAYGQLWLAIPLSAQWLRALHASEGRVAIGSGGTALRCACRFRNWRGLEAARYSRGRGRGSCDTSRLLRPSGSSLVAKW